MDDISIAGLLATLAVLIVMSGFFSSSETALMALNRYRLKHLVEQGHRGAILANRLLQRPDRLIGVILLGNNAVNIIAASLATVIGYRLYGETGIVIASVLLTFAIIIFAEVTPKTLAALYPERVAFPVSYILLPLLKATSIFVIGANFITNGLLRLAGVSPGIGRNEALNREELKTIVQEAGSLVPDAHQEMLLSILDLETFTVEDVMIPRNEIVGIDLDDDWVDIIEQLIHTQHTRIPVFRENLDQIIGFTHLKRLLKYLKDDSLTEEILLQDLRPPYFIPETTPLNKQLLNFQKEKRRVALAVDEYGDVQGLVALEDILEEIVGEFTTDPLAIHQDIFPQEDGSYLINAAVTIRELKRSLQWDLPTDGPKTLNGLILEYMQDIPQSGTSLRLYGNPVEILQTQHNSVKTVKLNIMDNREPQKTGASRTENGNRNV